MKEARETRKAEVRPAKGMERPPRDRMMRSDEVWRRVRREARKERGETHGLRD